MSWQTISNDTSKIEADICSNGLEIVEVKEYVESLEGELGSTKKQLQRAIQMIKALEKRIEALEKGGRSSTPKQEREDISTVRILLVLLH